MKERKKEERAEVLFRNGTGHDRGVTNTQLGVKRRKNDRIDGRKVKEISPQNQYYSHGLHCRCSWKLDLSVN